MLKLLGHTSVSELILGAEGTRCSQGNAPTPGPLARDAPEHELSREGAVTRTGARKRC